MVCLALTKNRKLGRERQARPPEKTVTMISGILSPLRVRIELVFTAPLPLCETFGLAVTFEEGTRSAWLYDLLNPHVDKLLVRIRKKRCSRMGTEE